MLAILAFVVGFTTSSGVIRIVDALAAARDANAHISAIETILKSGNYLSSDTLTSVQGHLTGASIDLQRIQGDLPVEPVLARAPVSSGVVHTLAMGQDFVRAGQYGIGAAQLLIPHLKGILSGLSSAPGSAPPGAAGSPLTQEVIAQAKQDIVTAAYWAAQALAERQQVTDTDLSRVGLGSLVPTLHRLDSMAPQLSADLGYATKAMDALPAAAGLAAPAKYLLFLMDSDELRATGGFLGNYAVVTVSQGKIVGGIQLHDIATLDCPGGSCPSNTVPSRFSWFTVSPNHFALRDSNLDPDFPASARFAQQLFRGEGGPAVNGVIAVTPALIEAILKVTGPITVDAFKKSVSATTLQDTIHYFHITNFGNDPALAAQYATSGHKAFDAEMGSVLLKKVGSLAGAQ
jgi:hypothetical protein